MNTYLLGRKLPNLQRTLYQLALFISLPVGVLAQPPQGHALLVGVPVTTSQCVPGGRFDNAATAGVPNDLLRMHDVLDRAGFASSRIKTLSAPAETTPAAIVAALRAIKPNPGDLVFLYFSGHGDQVKDISGDEDDGMDEVLVGSNACLLDDDLRPIWVEYGPEVRIVMVVDACHAGSTFSFQDFAVAKDDGRRPANERPDRTGNKRTEPSRPLTGAEKQAQRATKFQRERAFEQSRVALGNCLDERVQRNEPYQMIYISASRDPTTTLGGPSGGLFTINFTDLLLSENTQSANRRNYRQLCLDIPSCPLTGAGGISYAEIGLVSNSFRNNFFLQIN